MDFEKEWFAHPDWWFNCTSDVDKYITKNYEHLLEEETQSLSPLSKILVFDQLPHHVFRGQCANHIITYYLQKALCIVNEILFSLDLYEDDQLCFILLPLRHTKDPSQIYKSIELVWNRISKRDSPVLRRFITASYQRCPLVGASLVAGNIVDIPARYKDILYHSSMYTPKRLNKNPNFPSRPRGKVVISLSGGVDSMVSSWILTQQYSTSEVCAIHVNYNNRPTSDEEASMVADWCTYIGIPCYIRKLHEIKRQPCMDHGLRSIYESYTRNVRYQCYKDLKGIIVLGHNSDDRLENIFTNIAHKSKYDNLDGMTEYSNQDGIKFWRPLLGVSKEEIIRFAKENHIPYLPNSTPEWSQRGQIRSTIVPVLDKWDNNFVDGMFQMSRMMRELHENLQSHVKSFLGRHKVDADGTLKIKFDTLSNSYMFWKETFSQLGVVVSDKSLKSFLQKLEVREKLRSNTCIVLSKYFKVKVCYELKCLEFYRLFV